MDADIIQFAVRNIYISSADIAADLSRFVDAVLIPSLTEKKANAEVSTPAPLRKDMLDRIPVEFWTVIRRVLEPCAGKGGFLVDMMGRFMVGLAPTIPDPVERRRVIVEECLYWTDINPFNVLVCNMLLNPLGTHNTKGYLGDSLALNPETQWGVAAFDAVVGNPPYNSAGNTGTGNTLWQKFVRRALDEWIAPNGLLVFVHPPGWRKPNSAAGRFTDMFALLAHSNTMVYLEMHGTADGMRVFGCGTRYDWYVVRAAPAQPDTYTIVHDTDNVTSTVRLAEWTWLPSGRIDNIAHIVARGDDVRCPIIQSMSAYEPRKAWISKTQTDVFRHPCVHSTPKSGTRYVYSNTRDRGHFGVPKVIFGDSGLFGAFVDAAGEFGMTQHAMAIQVADAAEGAEILAALKSRAFQDCLERCMFSSFAIDWTLFAQFKADFWRTFELRDAL
jgi:hypothetical protein